MRPLATITHVETEPLRGVCFDVDDTVLTEGRLTRAATEALFRLQESGLRAVAVTGRSAGWGRVLAQQWPVDAALAENGAVGFVTRGRRVEVRDPVEREERRRRQRRLTALAAAISERFPAIQLADDEAMRVSDLAFDVAENVQVEPSLVAEACAFAEGQGARTSVSSIHLHVTFDGADKASGALGLLGELFGEDATVARARYAFVGDSGNDAPAFAAFAVTIGVANLRGRFTRPPRFIARAAAGAGFAEAVDALLETRRG